MTEKGTLTKKAIFWIIGPYVIIAGAYILLSDWALVWIAHDPHQMAKLAIFKGWGFILVTAWLLYLVLRRQLAKLEQAHDASQRLTQRLQHYLAASPAISYTMKVEGDRFVSIWVSENVERLLGYTVEEALQPNWWTENLHPEDRNQAQVDMSALSETGSLDHEYRFLCKNGTVIWIRDQLRLVRDKTGKPQEAIGVWVDITERKRAEKVLNDREEELTAIYDNAPLIMVLVDENWTIRKTNAFTAQFVGTTANNMVNRRCGEALHCVHACDSPEGCGFGPSCKECALRLTALNTIETGRSRSSEEIKMSFSDGKNEREATFLISTKKLLIRDQPLALVSMQDITERKQAENERRERESFIRAVLDNLPIGVAVNSVDPSVAFNYMNDLFPTFYRTTKEALNDPDAFWNAVYEDPEFREEIKKRVLDDCASGDPTRMFWPGIPITRKGSETTFISAQNVPVPYKQLMISIVWDVTKYKRAEAQIQEHLQTLSTLYSHAQRLSESLDQQEIADQIVRLCGEELSVRLAWLGAEPSRMAG